MTAKREFFSTNEIAQILGISPFTVRRYIQLRKLKAVKLEGSYRVRRADLDAFIEAREIETEEELTLAEETSRARKAAIAQAPPVARHPIAPPEPRAKPIAQIKPRRRPLRKPATATPIRAKRSKEEKE